MVIDVLKPPLVAAVPPLGVSAFDANAIGSSQGKRQFAHVTQVVVRPFTLDDPLPSFKTAEKQQDAARRTRAKYLSVRPVSNASATLLGLGRVRPKHEDGKRVAAVSEVHANRSDERDCRCVSQPPCRVIPVAAVRASPPRAVAVCASHPPRAALPTPNAPFEFAGPLRNTPKCVQSAALSQHHQSQAAEVQSLCQMLEGVRNERREAQDMLCSLHRKKEQLLGRLGKSESGKFRKIVKAMEEQKAVPSEPSQQQTQCLNPHALNVSQLPSLSSLQRDAEIAQWAKDVRCAQVDV